ncbi:NAD(P)/FAD-dependent oxidoreductase [Agaribacter marinus]|uniref:Ferredoxin reductase n=1 Tax=Agaribacter marinus TaxID=1431249 RepID=A0AA37WI51_9ALTE|nr:FAD-dependent oxidoreductase [Agaribacter marinus]GLR70517.1 putative ferredoxin reductase [Agaribacter marinus]
MQGTESGVETLSMNAVVIGASHAGVNFAFNLRQQGWQGTITVVDSDPELPYHRPPLSKKTLQTTECVPTPLKAEKAYADSNIQLRLGQTVDDIDRENKQIKLAAGDIIGFDKLVIATGCSPFIPPIPGLLSQSKYFAMRTYADVKAIQSALSQSSDKDVVIIGGGYIGLESAASFKSLGANVTVIEKQEKILSRVTSPVMSEFLSTLHINKGISLETTKDVVGVKQRGNKQVVVCGDGTEYLADFILVGVGVRLNTQLAINAGLIVEEGIKVNGVCQTSDPDIFAIGDCTKHFSTVYDRWIRLESVQNAVDQAKGAAQYLTKGVTPAPVVPWFWSDQYEYKLQIVGLSQGYDDLVVRNEDEGQFSVWYFQGERLLCVEAVNHTKSYVLGTQIIKKDLRVNKQLIADTSTPLSKELLV